MRPLSLAPSTRALVLIPLGALAVTTSSCLAADRPAADTPAGTLVVHIGPLPDAVGQVVVNLYDKAEGFPKAPLRQARQPATQQAPGGEATVVIPDVPGGRYAVLAFQDRKGDGKLARNFIGIPTEAYGFSGAPAHFGPPAFEDAAFRVPATGGAVTIKLK